MTRARRLAGILLAQWSLVGGAVSLIFQPACSLLNEPLVSCDPIKNTGCSDATLTCQLSGSDPQTTDCVSLTNPPEGPGASCQSHRDCLGGYACANGSCTELCRLGDASTCASQPAACVPPIGSQLVFGFCAAAGASSDAGTSTDGSVAPATPLFGVATGHSLSTGNGLLIEIAIGDITGDGKPDIVVQADGKLIPLVNGGAGFTIGAALSITGDYFGRFALARTTGGSNLDLTIGSVDSLTVYPGAGSSSFQAGLVTNYTGAYGSIQQMIAGKFTGDTKPDVVVLDQNGMLFSFVGAGNGSFSSPTSAALGSSVDNDLQAVDVNGDGVQDLEFTNSAGLNVVTNGGAGTFASIATFPSMSGALAIGDLNSDGHPDAAVGDGQIGGQIDILLSIDGASAQSATRSLNGKPVAIVDFDGDGKRDLLTRVYSSLFLYRGDGAGGFDSGTELMVACGDPQKVVVDDLNADARPDIVVGCPADVSSGADIVVSVSLNTGAVP